MTKIYLIYFLSLNAWAIKGQYASQEHENQASCKISFQFKNSKGTISKGICSASLISSKVLTVVEHCLGDIESNFNDSRSKLVPTPKAICGGEEIEITSTSHLSDMGFDQTDVGFLELATESTKKPFDIPFNVADYLKLLEDPHDCYLNGYGLDNDNKYGVLKSAAIKKLSTETPISINLERTSDFFQVSGNVPDHGDSGGGVFCERDQKNYLIGVISGVDPGATLKNIEKLEKLLFLLQHIQSHNKIDKEFFVSLEHHQRLCDNVAKCKTRMEIGHLSLDVSAVVKKMDHFFEDLKKRPGTSMEYKEIQKANDKLIEFYNDQDCYRRLYPVLNPQLN